MKKIRQKKISLKQKKEKLFPQMINCLRDGML